MSTGVIAAENDADLDATRTKVIGPPGQYPQPVHHANGLTRHNLLPLAIDGHVAKVVSTSRVSAHG